MNRRPARRLFLLLLLIPVLSGCGYGLLRVAAHNGWIILTLGQRKVDVGVERRPGDSESSLSVLIVGDTGSPSRLRESVVAAMERHAQWSSPDFALMLGDNFYESGVQSIDDPRFQSDFENLFAPENFRFPFYVCLGNHDYGGNVEAQVEYSGRSERWRMPSKYFQFSRSVGRQTVGFFVLDTVEIHEQLPGAAEQLNWLESSLSASQADWKIVIGHHPAITGGRHEASEVIEETLPPLFERFGVIAYLSGHDHDLQLCDSGRGWVQVVCGSGSKLRSTSWIDQTKFASATPGFCWLLLDDGRLSISYYSPQDRLYSCDLNLPVDRQPDSGRVD